MAVYENQSDMHHKRAEKSKKQGDMYYAKAMEAKENKNKEDYKKFLAQAKHRYNSQEENEKKAIRDEGKTWK